MQLDAQTQTGHDGVTLPGGVDLAVPGDADIVNVDADMGEGPDEQWLQRKKVGLLAGSEIFHGGGDSAGPRTPTTPPPPP